MNALKISVQLPPTFSADTEYQWEYLTSQKLKLPCEKTLHKRRDLGSEWLVSLQFQTTSVSEFSRNDTED